MGRHSKHPQTIEDTLKISLTYLQRNGFIRKGFLAHGSLSWSNGAEMAFESQYTDREKYIRLTYASKSNGVTQNYDYRIRLTTAPSNLGKGEVVFFVCPSTFRHCRNLYFSNYTRNFVSRHAFNERFYYGSQLASKLNKANERYWAIKSKLEELAKRKETFLYKGRKTRYAFRVERLVEKQEIADYLRWMPESMPLGLRGLFKGWIETSANP